MGEMHDDVCSVRDFFPVWLFFGQIYSALDHKFYVQGKKAIKESKMANHLGGSGHLTEYSVS